MTFHPRARFLAKAARPFPGLCEPQPCSPRPPSRRGTSAGCTHRGQPISLIPSACAQPTRCQGIPRAWPREGYPLRRCAAAVRPLANRSPLPRPFFACRFAQAPTSGHTGSTFDRPHAMFHVEPCALRFPSLDGPSSHPTLGRDPRISAPRSSRTFLERAFLETSLPWRAHGESGAGPP